MIAEMNVPASIALAVLMVLTFGLCAWQIHNDSSSQGK